MSKPTPRPTTAQAQAERAATKHQTEVTQARYVLIVLMNARATLRSSPLHLTQTSRALTAEIEFLVQDSEAFRDAAASLYTEETRATDGGPAVQPYRD